jgi:hypothetical protein
VTVLLQDGNSLREGRLIVPRSGKATLLQRPPMGGKIERISDSVHGITASLQTSMDPKKLLSRTCEEKSPN